MWIQSILNLRLNFKEKMLELFSFKNDEIIIGSFQKDGQGWGDGTMPKLIKGPDIFAKWLS